MKINMATYAQLINLLKNMGEVELMELFYDLESLRSVKRIANCATEFCKLSNKEVEEEDMTENDMEEELREWDNKQRYKDIKSTQEQYK